MCGEVDMILADYTSHSIKIGQMLEEYYEPLGHILLITKKILSHIFC